MQTLAQLTDNFAIPGILRFEQHDSLLSAHIQTPAAEATVYLHGAHLTHWQPRGHQPVLFTSATADYKQGKAIRGGIPVIFPWFGARLPGPSFNDPKAPQHGFARTQTWSLDFAAHAGDDLHLSLTLAPTEVSRSYGYGPFRLALNLTIGRTLTAELTLANDHNQPLTFEEALHTYLAVADVREVSIAGLKGELYLDKTEGLRRTHQTEDLVRFTCETDRPYLNTAATCTLHDPVLKRRITVEKSGSSTTVVWNPWSELAAKLPDMEPDGWLRMVCIETANAMENAITLPPGETHTMRAILSVA